MGVEVLIPDFNGAEAPLRTVMDAAPDILNHNLETVRRLQKPVRKRARWDRSLGVLERAKAYAGELGHDVHTKSSLMVGLGETRDELTRGVRGPARGRLRHPHDRPVPAPDDGPPAARALLPPRRVRRDEGERARRSASSTWSQGRSSAPSYHARDQVPGAELKALRRRATIDAEGRVVPVAG